MQKSTTEYCKSAISPRARFTDIGENRQVLFGQTHFFLLK